MSQDGSQASRAFRIFREASSPTSAGRWAPALASFECLPLLRQIRATTFQRWTWPTSVSSNDREPRKHRRIKSELSRYFSFAVQFSSMALIRTDSYLKDSLDIFRYYKTLGERAMNQCSDAALFETLDKESEAPASTRAELMDQWNAGWNWVFSALEPLSDADLTKTVFIRGEAHSVMQAINRQIAHYSYHVGQIVFLAKHFGCDNWKSLTVPRKQSAAFNADVAAGKKSQR